MSKKTSYADEQMIHTLKANGETQHDIASALGINRSTVQAVLRREPTASELPEIIGDGCSYLLLDSGAGMNQDEELLTPLDIEELDLTVLDHPTGQLRGLDSGYPGIIYDERHKKWEVWIHNKRIWRASKLTKACEVRLSKGGLSEHNEELLRAVVDASPEIQAVLDEIPV